METKRHETTVIDTTVKGTLTDLPSELIESIFEYLSAVDLSHVASCNRHLRSLANMDAIWRPLCLRNGWERYGNITDLTKEIPYKPQDVSGRRNDVSFNMAAIVRQDSTLDLVATCRWKEIYMKANHLENNWTNKRFHVSILKPGEINFESAMRPSGRKVVIDKDSLVIIMSNDTIQIWDVKTETCRHFIPAISRGVGCLSISDGKLAVGSKDGVIRTFSSKTGEILHLMRGTREDHITHMFNDAELIISAAIPDYIPSEDVKGRHIYVWNAEDGALRHIFKIDVEGAILKDIDYRDKMVVGAYSDKCLRLWDAVTGDCLHTLRYNCEGITERVSCCLGNGIIALFEFNGMKLVVWNKQSGDCVTSLSIFGDFEDLDDYKCEAVDDLIVISFYNHAEYHFNVYNQKGQMLIQLFDLDGISCVCCHGNKFVFQGQGERRDFENCGFYKAFPDSIKRMWTIQCTGVLEGIDDTKMVLYEDSGLLIYHYW